MRISKQHTINFYKISLLFFLLFMGLANNVYAAAPPSVDPTQFDSTAAGFQTFYTSIGTSVKSVIESPVLSNFSLIMWKFFAAILLIWQLTMYAMKGLDFSELFAVIFMIMVTRILMLQYDTLTMALWGWSEAFASGIQMSVVGVSDEFFAPRYIWNLMTSFDWPASNFLFHPLDVVTAITMSLTACVLSILGFFATVWALWGYSLSKMIGFMFIPTLLFERLSWLFDGWLRWFFGFLIYNVVARANLMLVVIALHAYMQLGAGVIPQNSGYVFQFNSLVDLLGLLTFLVLSIVGLLSTGMFVRSIVSGSNTGMLSGGASSLASGAKTLANHVASYMG